MRDSIVVILGGRGASVCVCTLKESICVRMCVCVCACVMNEVLHINN